MQKQINSLRRSIVSINDDLDSLSKKRSHTNYQCKESRAKESLLTHEIQSTKTSITIKKNTIENLDMNSIELEVKSRQKELQSKNEHLALLALKQKSIENNINIIDLQLSKNLNDKIQLQIEIAKQEEKVKILRTNIESQKDLSDTVRYLRSNLKDLENIPLLSEIINCQEKYIGCIQNFLQDYLYYFIVQDRTQVNSIVNSIGENTRDKICFFMLNAFSELPKVEIDSKDILSARSVVSCVNIYDKIL